MGLLTSDASNSCSSIGKRLNQHHALLTVTVCSLAISGFLLLPCEQITDRTYFSENALLPGLVQRRFADHVHIERSLQQLQQGSRASGDRLPVELLTRMFVEQGLHVYEHNFTFTYPFGRRTSSVGRNLYALIRAPRSAGTEAIVLSSPYRSETSPHGSSLPGIALLLSLGRYFARQTYWAKDIIILVYEHELIGCQAWLQAYHSNPTLGRMSMTDESHDQVIRAGDLAFRSGQIQAAINLEVHSSLSSRLDIKIEGFNGQLPNLDLFNVAVELATRESCTPTFHGRSHSFSGSNRDLWLEYAQTLCK